MCTHLHVLGLRQDLQQLVVGQEIEAGEGHALCLKVVLKVLWCVGGRVGGRGNCMMKSVGAYTMSRPQQAGVKPYNVDTVEERELPFITGCNAKQSRQQAVLSFGIARMQPTSHLLDLLQCLIGA